jgi:hypothetical protein
MPTSANTTQPGSASTSGGAPHSAFRLGAQPAAASKKLPVTNQHSIDAAAAVAANKQATDWLEMRRAAGWEPLVRTQAK